MNRHQQPVLLFATAIFKGFAQIMLQDHVWTGVFFLVGICCGSYTMGIAGVLAVLAGTCTAKLFGYDQTEINSGLYGFSAALVGVGLAFLFKTTAVIWIAIFFGAIMATIVQHFFMARKIPVYTLPFILVTWAFIFVFHHLPLMVHVRPVAAQLDQLNFLSMLSFSFGQVIFQGSFVAGILFFIGVLVSRPVAALYGVVAALCSGALAYLFGQPVTAIFMGLMGYNAVLCAITFAGTKTHNAVLAFVAVTGSVVLMVSMLKMDMPALTFPFVCATWAALILKRIFKVGVIS